MEQQSSQHAELIRRRTRRRLLYCALVFACYAVFGLQYSGLAPLFTRTLVDGSRVNVSIALFCSLILLFLALEYIYIRGREREDEQRG